MDLFFVCALGWGQAGGLDIGQTLFVARAITDGDPDAPLILIVGDADNGRMAARDPVIRADTRSLRCRIAPRSPYLLVS